MLNSKSNKKYYKNNHEIVVQVDLQKSLIVWEIKSK